uniref:Perilipin n=1 Tax=Pelusios castaneus TaxID=367368 RepID=A0A8C8RM90_9SAUR
AHKLVTELSSTLQNTYNVRVAGLPLVSSAYAMAATAYTSTKDSHPYIKVWCDAAEKGVRTFSEVAISKTQPILTSFEPQNFFCCHPLFSSLVDVTREALQGSVESTKSVMTHSVTVLEKSEEMLDQYLPITAEELAELATSTKEVGVAPVQQQSYFVHLGSLSSKLRHRAYQHSLDKIKNTRQSIQESLSKLHQTIDLIEDVKQGVDQTLQDGREKLHQMWLDWHKRQAGETKDKDLHLESHALTMFQNIIQQLQATCLTLLSSIQGFPSNIQDKVQKVRHSTKELQASFSTIHSFQDLSSSILAQSHKKVTKAQEYMDELLEYIVHNTPLSWLVGPFMLSSTIPEDGPEFPNR